MGPEEKKLDYAEERCIGSGQFDQKICYVSSVKLHRIL